MKFTDVTLSWNSAVAEIGCKVTVVCLATHAVYKKKSGDVGHSFFWATL